VIAKFEMGINRKVLLGSDRRPVVVDQFAEVCCFSCVLLLADIGADEIDAVTVIVLQEKFL
jgi:hypothetical protein